MALCINSKNAQLTMFIILGLVIISVFGFVFFISGQVQTQRAQAQTEQIISNLLETTSLKFYTTRCTEEALTQGMDIISKQGGKIFPGQKGSLLKFPEKVYSYQDQNGKEYEVAYGILKDDIPSPQYPCKTGFLDFNLPPAFCMYRADLSKFNNLEIGSINLPALCKDRTGGCSLQEGWDPRFSVQAQLESFMASYLRDCVDFTSIEGINETYNIKEGNVSANITFSDTEVRANVNFPILVSPIGSQPVYQIVRFQNSIPTRFKQMYSFARTLVTDDVVTATATTNIKTFKVIPGFNDIVKKKFGTANSGFTIEKKENVSQYDDLIQIFDTLAEQGKISMMQFMIENRPPVLEYPTKGSPVGKPGCGIYDIVELEGNLWKFVPSAFDIEGDAISYSYSGWLQDYNETITKPNVNNGCLVDYVSTKTNFDKTKPSQVRWKKISDQDFKKTGTVFAQLTDMDIGPHLFNVTVCDSQYCDFETIRILVDDVLKIKLNKSNKYGNEIFSIEDPYNITATIIDIYNPGNYGFSWQIREGSGTTLGAIKYTQTNANQSLLFPLQSYNMLNINARNRFLDNSPLILGGTYTVSGIVSQMDHSSQDDTIFTVEKCVPYASTNPPFPYNTTDPFLGNHACCSKNVITGTISILGQDTTCYSNTSYGSFKSFNPQRFLTEYDGDFLPNENTGEYEIIGTYTGFTGDLLNSANPFSQSTNVAAANDLFKREFKRSCSNDRGNICTGPRNEYYSVAESCQDKNPATEVATCFGPKRELLKSNTETSQKPSCESYGRVGVVPTTFEKEIGLRNDTLCNLKSKCVSKNNAADGFTNIDASNAHFVCNATCGPTGCTRTLDTQTSNLCMNCYERQSCFKASENVIYSRSYMGCNDGTNGGQCQISSEQAKINKCNDTKTELTVYACLSDFSNSPVPYTTTTQDCINERPAILTPTNSNSIDSPDAICTYYTLGSCYVSSPDNQQCIGGYERTCEQGRVYTDFGVPRWMYQECQKVDTPGTKNYILDSCNPVLHDYDETQALCAKLRYIQNDIEKYGQWLPITADQNGQIGPCCGDEISEEGSCP